MFYGHLDIAKLIYSDENYLGVVVVVFTTVGVVYILIKICEWYIHDWSTHPIAQNLATYSNNNTSWLDVAADINKEYRRFI